MIDLSGLSYDGEKDAGLDFSDDDDPEIAALRDGLSDDEMAMWQIQLSNGQQPSGGPGPARSPCRRMRHRR